MEPLHHVIGLRMVIPSHVVLGPKQVAELGPECAGGMPPAVSNNALLGAVVLDPVVEEGSGALLDRDAGEQDCGRPAGEPVHNGEEK